MLSQGLLGDGTVCVITDDYTEELNLAENIGYSNTTSGLSASNVQGAIDEVDSNLSTKLNGTFELLCNIGAMAGLYTLANNRKFSDYKYIIVYISDGNVTYDSFTYPTSILPTVVSATNDVAIGIDTTRLGQRAYAIFTYKSDTQIYIQANQTMVIYGAK
jgi:hypothetical protein